MGSGGAVMRVEPRRRWSDEEKLAILKETTQPGAIVALVARRYGIGTGQLYTWRKQLLRGAMAGFVPVEVMGAEPTQEDVGHTELLRQAWRDCIKVYGYRKLHDDLLDQGETSCPNRIARLTRLAGIKAQIGYKRRTGSYGGKPTLAVDNKLARQFDVAAPDRAWVTDITYIRTMEGFAYLAVVIDLYSRGWSIAEPANH